MENQNTVWAQFKGFKCFSADHLEDLKEYFSSNDSGGGTIAVLEQEELPGGVLLKIVYKDTHVAARVLNQRHSLTSIINGNFENPIANYSPLPLSNFRPACWDTTTSLIPESDDENEQGLVGLTSAESGPENLPIVQNISFSSKYTTNKQASVNLDISKAKGEPDYQKNIECAPPVSKLSNKTSVLLAENIYDVDNQLLAHWIKTLTGIWPLSCHINCQRDKAVIKVPEITDLASLFEKACEEPYFLRGVAIKLSILGSTKEMLAEFSGEVSHKDAVDLYFKNPDCGLKKGKLLASRQFDEKNKAFLIEYDNHQAILDVIQKGNHELMGMTIKVGEFYHGAGYCKPEDFYVFPAIEDKDFTASDNIRLLVKNVLQEERKRFKLLMRNESRTKGDKSAKIDFAENTAYVCYADVEVTKAVFQYSRRQGIYMKGKRLEVELETTELTSIHDHQAVRLSGLPNDVDPDRVKFYLSAVAENLVTSLLIQEHGDRAVAYFKKALDIPSLYRNSQSMKLDGYQNIILQPELKSIYLLLMSTSPNVDQEYLELLIEDVLPQAHSFKVEERDPKSTWIVSGDYEDIEHLRSKLSKRKELRISNYSDFLGTKVTKGIQRRSFLLSDIVKEQILLNFLLDNQLPGYKRLSKLVQNYDCELSEDGMISMNFDSLNYMLFNKKWEDLIGLITSKMTTSWCVDKSIILPEEIAEELSHTLFLSKQKVRLSCHEEHLIIAGERNDVNETVSVISRAIKEIDDKKREEKETISESLKLKNYEFAYLSLLHELSELKCQYPVKELSLDNSNCSLVILTNKKHINDVKKAIRDITSSLCESTVSKSEMFIKKCQAEFARQNILENLKANHLLAVYVPDRTKITAYAKTKEIAQMALKCIDEVVWEEKYPVGRTFDADEKKFLQKNPDLWKKAKHELFTRDSSVDITEALDDTCFVIIGYGKGNQNTVLKEINEFFNKFLPKSKTFVGNTYHIKYMSRFMNTEIKTIEQNTDATVSCKKDKICLTGSDEHTSKAEEQLRSLHNRIINDKHKVEVDFHIQFLLNESEIIKDLGKACQTLIVLENGDKLRKRGPESSKAKSNLVLQIHITQTTTLQVKNAEIHEILDCDGLAIPTSRNLKLGELNGPFAKYIKNQGGAEVFNECMNSPVAVKSGKYLLPGSILTTSAGEFRELKRIIHMVLVDWSRSDTVIVLEKCLKSAFISAREQGIMALLIPMSSFPEDYDYDMVIGTLIKTIKAFADDLPPRIVLLETQATKINELRSSLNEEFKSGRTDSETALRMPNPTSGSDLGNASPKPSKSIMGSQASNNELQKLSETQLLIGGCKFTVEKRLLQECQRQVIVNSTGESMNLQDNPLAKALDEAAGPGLMLECTTLAPLNEGEVKVSKAYNLKCQRILHCRINGKYAGSQSEKDLTGLIIECLRKVDQDLQLTSVAFPALGTGLLLYPAPVVANCLINGLKEYTRRNTVKHLKEVVAVVFPSDIGTYMAFLDAIEKSGRALQNQVSPAVSQEIKLKKQQPNQETFKNVRRDASCSLNNAVIAVQQGYLLEYTGKAIVCPTNKQLNSNGTHAFKLMKDPYIEQEARKANLTGMRSDGVCLIRTCAGKVKIEKYRAEYIFFVDSKSQSDSVVTKCLEKCLENKIESIAFPFIGAGLGGGLKSAEKKAKNLLTAAIEFVSRNGDAPLKNIDFIVFGSEPYRLFQTALIELKEQPSLLGRLAGAIKSFGSWLGPSNDKETTELAPSIPPYEDSLALHITIYGVEQAQIQATKKKLNERLEKEVLTIQWDSLVSYEEEKDLIANLSAEQVKVLEDTAKGMGVSFMLDQELKNIQITGNKTVIYDYRDLVKIELQEVEKAIFARKFQEYQATSFSWSYRQDVEEKWRDFDWEDSHHLESNYKLNPAAVLMFSSKEFKETLKIDLKKKAFKLHGSNYTIKCIDKAAGFPDGWDEDAGEQAEVLLRKGSDEYLAVEANFKSTIKNPNVTILEIKRVQHLTAYKQYMEQRRLVAYKLKKPENQVERVPLWHASTEDTIRKIAQSFFNRRYSGLNATLYGKGSYFARDSCYSANDTYSKPNSAGEKYMFQVRVIVGEYELGKTNMIDCPFKADGTQYNSVVDNVKDPSIFVVFDDAAAYPEYIIKFRM